MAIRKDMENKNLLQYPLQMNIGSIWYYLNMSRNAKNMYEIVLSFIFYYDNHTLMGVLVELFSQISK